MPSQEFLDQLLTCAKRVVSPPRQTAVLRQGSFRNGMELASTDGNYRFNVFMRQNKEFPERFSVGLEYVPVDGSGCVILIRCNGVHTVGDGHDERHHRVRHVHLAREENLASGKRAEAYSEPCMEFSTFDEAVQFFCRRVNIVDIDDYLKPKKGIQQGLFDVLEVPDA